MNSAAAGAPQHLPRTAPTHTAPVAEHDTCFHCALPVPAATHFRIRFDGKMHALCCAGCEAVARTIIDADLGTYYLTRTSAAQTPATDGAVGALFDLGSVQSMYVASPDATTRQADLYIDGITCAACVWLAETALARVPGVAVFLTSNATRELSEALKRRCLYLHLDYPDAAREKAIVLSRVPEVAEQLAEQLVRTVRALRALDLKKSPSIAESIDWAQTLVALGLDTLDEEAVKSTLGVVLKHASDHARAAEQLKLN